VIIDERTCREVARTSRFHEIRQFGEIDSTNRYVLDRARAGTAEGLVAVAELQRAGRGRLGRSWTAPPGTSLLVSVLLRPPLPPERMHLATVAMALAAATACEEVAGVRPELKWPNDLVVGGAKLAGVLAETDAGAVVVGLGLNVDWPEGALPEGAVSLDRVSAARVERGQLLAALLGALEGRCRQLGDPGGRAELAADHRAALVTLGQVVRAELSTGVVVGIAEQVDDRGHLLVRTPDGARLEVAAGDVVHLRPAGPTTPA